mmetsp:Transcript_43132/g.119304  ORF Transcript_43132/g.119304 Transcript_43132/m.119304 type:complete len:637 (+) Transcript_43132:40-1950(+)
MGNSFVRCHDPSLAETLGDTCQDACKKLHSATTVPAPLTKLEACAWDEEVIANAALYHGGTTFGVDGGVHGRSTSTCSTCPIPATLRAPSRSRAPLFEPGSLAPVHRVDKNSHGLHNGDETSAENVVRKFYAVAAQPLGRGSYGEVIQATHRRTGARRAIKAISKCGLHRYLDDVSCFLRREIDIIRSLDHPNILRFYEAYEDDVAVFMVLELCEGGDVLERVAVGQDRLQEREAAAMFLQMLSAVQHLYSRGVVHRDLKPENFLFTRSEKSREPLLPAFAPVKLIDFGLSRRLSFETGLRLTPRIGTAEYMAPEAYAGCVDAMLADRMDMWSLGVLLHVVFTGHFPSSRVHELGSTEYLASFTHISPMGRHFLALLLRLDPQERPTANIALTHPWVDAAVAREHLDVARAIPAAMRSSTAIADLRKLAFMIVAREVDDCVVWELRQLFQALALECNGVLTRRALEHVALRPGHLAAVAKELAGSFEAVDMDGSHTIEWTELLATIAGLSIGSQPVVGMSQACPMEAECEAGSVAFAQNFSYNCLLDADTCWRAFDLLSFGSGEVSTASLSRLFDCAGGSADVACSFSTTSGTSGGFDSEAALRMRRAQMVEGIVHEVDSTGVVSLGGFVELVRSG